MTGEFTKTGPESRLEMFEAEAEGLAELQAAAAIRVPQVIAVGVANGRSFITLERLELGAAGRDTERRLGEQLAALHRHTAGTFGWHRDNSIGLTLQRNRRDDDWTSFFRSQRLQFQLDLIAARRRDEELLDLGARVAGGLDRLFAGHRPVASLLHGDLWSGNWGSVAGEPVVFDPAVYYGDRESDIAMTRLFGGFGAAFYAAYESAWPLAPGHEDRCRLYQLYHVLNHVNLFGTGYRSQAMHLLRELARVV